MITDTDRLPYLPEQRWFGHKDARLERVELIDEVILSDGPPALVIAIVAVTLEGRIVYYQLPLLVDEDGSSRDATEEPERLKLLGELMAQGDSVKGSTGIFHFGGPGLDPLAPAPGSRSVRTIGAEQSNTSVVFDEAVILKFFRRLDVGPNRDPELIRLLTSEGFDHVPAQVGELTYEGLLGDDEVEMDLGIAQLYLPDGVDAWGYVLRAVESLYDQVDPADAPEDRRFLTEERSGELLDLVGELGDVIASMHVTLSRGDEPSHELVPEVMESTDVEDLRLRILRSLVDTPRVASARRAIESRVEMLSRLDDLGAKTRVHGDLHLGQVLSTPRGWMILDFEGEPLRTLEARRMKQSPLKDVAGMLRSFNYAAVAALFDRYEPDSDEWIEMEPWAQCWEALARERFLTGYLTRAHEGRFLPADRAALGELLAAFEIEKALYELAYEEGHRPHWVRIPEHGIRRIVEG